MKLSLEEIADGYNQTEGDFLSSLKEPKSAKGLWAEMYFYLIGDPMKQKDNKVRSYIKTQLATKSMGRSERKRKQYITFKSGSTKKISSSKKVTFHDEKSVFNKRPIPKSSRKEILPFIENEFKKLSMSESKNKLRLRSKINLFRIILSFNYRKSTLSTIQKRRYAI